MGKSVRIKYYGVRKGRVPGVYRSWEECKLQVERYEGNLHESFATWEEAAAFVGPLAALPAQPGLWGHGKVV
ncbi:hypothetical protein T484DRAFT_1927024 [Baffinella frigidus]|nr:hypothetical protein T484DRAFT_1927024 [Cryptophyta sp. CCMP2293]